MFELFSYDEMIALVTISFLLAYKITKSVYKEAENNVTHGFPG